MFGYVIANLEGLTQAQKDRYKGCYCGLCRVLKQRHGFSGRLTLTYDMTFLVLLLSALYEADEERGMEICPAHPLRKHFYWQTRYTPVCRRKTAAILALRTLLPWKQTSSTWASGQTKEPLTKVLWTF